MNIEQELKAFRELTENVKKFIEQHNGVTTSDIVKQFDTGHIEWTFDAINDLSDDDEIIQDRGKWYIFSKADYEQRRVVNG